MDPIKLEHLRCQKCDDFYLLRDSLKGLFLAASQFPKNRETRAPFVHETWNDLPEKYHHFRSAPEKDSDGDNLVIRFIRKDGSHTLSSEKMVKRKVFFYSQGRNLERKSKRLGDSSLYIYKST